MNATTTMSVFAAVTVDDRRIFAIHDIFIAEDFPMMRDVTRNLLMPHDPQRHTRGKEVWYALPTFDLPDGVFFVSFDLNCTRLNDPCGSNEVDYDYDLVLKRYRKLSACEWMRAAAARDKVLTGTSILDQKSLETL